MASTIAKQDDGSIQINLSFPQSVIEEEQNHVLAEMAQNMTVPGFRKGKAPLEKVKEGVKQDDLVQKTLNHILPEAFWKAVEEHKLKPAMYPKFQINSLKDDWQVTALTCEIPDFEAPDYKNIKFTGKTKEEKEAEVLKFLLDNTKLVLPKILVEEEVNNRLSILLQRIEKLGLSLESYLTSINKNEQTLREEYEKQVREAVSLELILNKIAELEKTKVSDKEVDEVIKTAGRPDNPQERRIIASILQRRSVLDSLVKIK